MPLLVFPSLMLSLGPLRISFLLNGARTWAFVSWGAGCLGSLNPTIQMLFLMQPIYTLALWLRNEILYRLAKLKQNKALF